MTAVFPGSHAPRAKASGCRKPPDFRAAARRAAGGLTPPALLGLMLALLAFAPATARAAGPILPPKLENVGFDQRLNEQVPLDLAFTDSNGQQVRLGDYFHRGKPVILVLVYFQCPKLCNVVLNGLTQGMLEMSLTAGEKFEVVTVSFDPREHWPLAASKRESYLRRYGRPAAKHGWHFLTGEPDAIAALTQAVGFRYRYDSLRDQFIHASGITILTPQGKISRYFYDVRYSGRDLRLGLVEASQNKIGSPIDQILLYCFHYDANLGKYSATVMNFVRLGGVLTLVAIGGLVWFLRRSLRNGHTARWAADGAADQPGGSEP